MIQPQLDFTPRDRKALPEASRLSAQCRKIVDLLREGDQTNNTLAGVALKYTSRISDCRKAGFDIRVVSRSRKTGQTVYTLKQGDEA